MPDIPDGQAVSIQGSAARPYVLKNHGGVYSCDCPAWRNQSLPIDRRTCKHLRQYRGEQAERNRLGGSLDQPPTCTERGTPPPLLLAHPWDNEQDLSGYWMSEKLDGVRAFWDGQQFLSRQGNRFHAPAWFTRGLPKFPLDGELWIGRRRFQQTVSVVRRQDADHDWQAVRYVVFDAPATGQSFESRHRRLAELVRETTCEQLSLIEQVECRGVDHLRSELSRIESLGGEGLMLRQPGSHYEAGRSATLLKVKTFHDADATVVEQLPGAGRHRGRLGALLVTLPNGTRFSVGTGLTDAQRESPPAVGSRITFRYQELTDGGVPRFPSFLRVRTDEPA